MQQLCRCLPRGETLFYGWFKAMHTRIDLMLWSDTDSSGVSAGVLADAAGRVEAETLRIERMGSRFLPESEISRINRAEVGVAVQVSEELCALLARCLDYTRQTKGLFDITACANSPVCPGVERLRVSSPCVTRCDSGVRLDLSGCLKGYALDWAVSLLRADGVRNGLLNFGNSSVFGLGHHPCGTGWQVGYGDDASCSCLLQDECLTTSGNDTEARRHIVHPLTGRLVEGKRRVSVITRSGEEGEVWSIARFLSGEESVS